MVRLLDRELRADRSPDRPDPLVQADLLDPTSLTEAIEEARPAELYNLGAQSFVPTSWKQPVLTAEFTAVGVTRLLEATRRVNPDIRFYQASSSEMFGKVRSPAERTNPSIPARPTAWPRSTGTSSPSTTGSRTGSLLSPASSSTTSRLAGARVRYAQDLGRRRAHQARLRGRVAPGKPRREARLGLRRGLRRGDVDDVAAVRARGLRPREREEHWSGSSRKRPSATSGSTTSST